MEQWIGRSESGKVTATFLYHEENREKSLWFGLLVMYGDIETYILLHRKHLWACFVLESLNRKNVRLIECGKYFLSKIKRGKYIHNLCLMHIFDQLIWIISYNFQINCIWSYYMAQCNIQDICKYKQNQFFKNIVHTYSKLTIFFNIL